MKVMHYYLNFGVKKKREKRNKKVAVFCMINKICAGVYQPQESQVKNCKNSKMEQQLGVVEYIKVDKVGKVVTNH